MLEDLKKARRHHEHHAFKRREKLELSAGARESLQGATGAELDTFETERRMLQGVMPVLMESGRFGE